MAQRGGAVKRFWQKMKFDRHGCWEWKAALKRDGYGWFSLAGRPAMAHRMAFFLAYQGIPIGLCVCHRCDNGKCVCPSHLWLGTYKENLTDMRAKGRAQNYGERQKMSKLTVAKVCQIRSRAAESSVQLAAEFGVNARAIRAVRGFETWRSV